MVSPHHARLAVGLVDNMLARLDERDHPGLRPHLLAARIQFEAVRVLMPVSTPVRKESL